MLNKIVVDCLLSDTTLSNQRPIPNKEKPLIEVQTWNFLDAVPILQKLKRMAEASDSGWTVETSSEWNELFIRSGLKRMLEGNDHGS